VGNVEIWKIHTESWSGNQKGRGHTQYLNIAWV